MSINYNTSDYDKKYIEWLKEENRRLAEQLRWHPFPDEKPPIDGNYLVTTTKRIVTIYFLRDSDRLYFSDVIAWAELPKPYKGGE